jgi:hypothetical protein
MIDPSSNISDADEWYRFYTLHSKKGKKVLFWYGNVLKQIDQKWTIML